MQAPSTKESVLVIGFYQNILTGKIMMPLTQSNSFNPPQWRIPGGGVKEGEDAVQAAKREYLEETGLLVENLRFFDAIKKPSRTDCTKIHTQHIFVGEIPRLAGFKVTTMDGHEWLTNMVFPVDDIRMAISHNVKIGSYDILHLHIDPLKKAFGKIFG